MRDHPEDMGWRPTATGGPRVAAATGNPLAGALGALFEGLRSRDFWLMSGSFLVCGPSTNGLIGTHLIPACVDHGITEVTGASLLAGTGVLNFIGAPLRAGSATARTTGFCCSGITGCAACR